MMSRYQRPVLHVLQRFSADVEWCDGLWWMGLQWFQSILSGQLPPPRSIFPGRDLHDQCAALPKGDLAIPKGVVVLEQVTFDAVDMAGNFVLFSQCPYQYQATRLDFEQSFSDSRWSCCALNLPCSGITTRFPHRIHPSCTESSPLRLWLHILLLSISPAFLHQHLDPWVSICPLTDMLCSNWGGPEGVISKAISPGSGVCRGAWVSGKWLR